MSGLHCTIPNGASAPGKVSPPPKVAPGWTLVPVKGSTYSVKKQMFFTIPGGPLAYTSQHGPLPLCELERALLLAAGMGVTAGTLAFLLR